MEFKLYMKMRLLLNFVKNSIIMIHYYIKVNGKNGNKSKNNLKIGVSVQKVLIHNIKIQWQINFSNYGCKLDNKYVKYIT